MTAPAPAPLLQIDGLTVQFGGLLAVSRIDLEVRPGEILSIIGPNGAGKTTVFNTITGIYEPAAGTIRFAGRELRRRLQASSWLRFALVGLLTGLGLLLAVHLEPLWQTVIGDRYRYRQPFPWGEALRAIGNYFRSQAAGRVAGPFGLGILAGGLGAFAAWQRVRRAPEMVARRGIARTFQNIRLFPEMTAQENVLIGMDRHLKTRWWHAALRLPLFWREERASVRRAREILEFVRLADVAGQRAENLAYGRQRRLEIARALASRPELLLLDEPAAGMNPAEVSDLMQLVRQIRERGTTVVLIEHHMPVVMGISDRIIVLDHGEKIAEGTPREICDNPRVVEAYLGKSYGTPAPA